MANSQLENTGNNQKDERARVALVTGATGFIGSHLARALAARGWAVNAVVRPGAKARIVNELAGQASVRLHTHGGNTAQLVNIVADVKPDVVFHLASLFLARHAPADVEPLIASNVLFSTQLVEAMAANGVTQLVNAGTSWQHFEGRRFDPVCLYAATKQAFEAILEFYIRTAGVRAITLKLFDTYGPGDPRPKLLHVLNAAAHSAQLVAMSPGEQLIDLVYIDDVIDAFMLAADRLKLDTAGGHESYAVSSGAPLRLRDMADAFERVSGKPLRIDWGGRPYRPREVMVPWKDGAPLPGWRPKISLEEGLKRVIALNSAT